MTFYAKLFILSLALLGTHVNSFTIPKGATRIRSSSIHSSITTSAQQQQQQVITHTGTKSKIHSSGESGETQAPQPQNFREAEILGLRLMQEGEKEEALKVFQQGLKLPGSRTDIIRTKNIPGPSPVGGSAGGTEGKVVQTLDEFEFQAAHYNIACAYASLNKIPESCKSLEQAFKYGFDNYATVRADPDLDSVQGTPEFDNLMERFDKKGFFGLFK